MPDNPLSTPLQPTTLYFYIGGFFCESHKIHLEGDEVVYGHSLGGICPQEKSRLKPSVRKWANFSAKIKEAGAVSWRRNYDDPGILDGTQWCFLLRAGTLKIRTSGSNDYPPKVQFDLVLRAFSNLVGYSVR